MAPDDDDKKVKDLIDAATRAELERWFGLPSFDQVEEQQAKAKAPEEDPDVVARRERREKAIEAVDPAMLEAHRRRTEPRDDLIRFKPNIELKVDPDVTFLDVSMVDKQASIAEPREVEIPEALRDDLRECTPQAILRDLHRPELDFEKVFEVVDFTSDRIDVVAAVDEVMTRTYKFDVEYRSPLREGADILRELRTDRYRSWAHALPGMPNRRVTE